MKATEKVLNHILEMLEKEDIYSRSVIDFDKENDIGYEDYNDRIYIDGVVTFDTMAEIVDYLREQKPKV